MNELHPVVGSVVQLTEQPSTLRPWTPPRAQPVHTPGPWNVAHADDGHARVGGGDDAPHVYIGGAISGRIHADAHLIAAAPDMLDALRAALSDLDEYSRSRPAVLAAIARAEGQS